MEKIKNAIGILFSLILIGFTIYLVKISYHNLPLLSDNEKMESKPTAQIEDTDEFTPVPRDIENSSSADTVQTMDTTETEIYSHLPIGSREDRNDSPAMPDSLKKDLNPEPEWKEKGEHAINPDFPTEFNPNTFFTRVARYAIPRVVRILNERGKESSSWNPFGEDDSDEDFYSGIGSGAIISPDGYIVTNNHVVDKADQLTVTLSDGEEYPAEIIGQDPLTDLALIKVKVPHPLPYFTFYMGDSIQIGEWVLAVGSPLNLVSSVTAGIVSAVKRNIRIIQSSYGIESFIQTDAVINPGNSGGPLLNIHGEIIGINTAIASRTGFYQSFGFAIPVDLITRVVNDLKKYGKVRRGYMGVSLLPLPFETAKENGLTRPEGVLVGGVQNDMPAQKAGIRKGDIILKINDEVVHAPNELQAKVTRFYPGDVVKVTVIRKGKEYQFQVKLKEVNVNNITRAEPEQTEPTELTMDRFDITIRNLEKDEFKEFHTGYGVYIEKSDNEQLPEKAIILEINGHKIFNVQNMSKLVEVFGKDGKEIQLLLKIPADDGFLEKEIVMK
jgi:Do/DeqQ family serine protease